MPRSPFKAIPTRPLPRWYLIPILAVAVVCLSGCVRRRMTIRTNPSGALVYVDDYPVGITPVSTDFTYYGTRKIRIVREGFETLTVMQRIPTPWYEIPPLDFFSENLVPGELRDRRVLTYQLRPQVVVPNVALRGRAEELRALGRVPTADAPPGFSTPLPPSPFSAQPPPLEPIGTPQGQSLPPGSQPIQPFTLNPQPLPPAQPQGPAGYPGPTSAGPTNPNVPRQGTFPGASPGWPAPPSPAQAQGSWGPPSGR